MARNNKPKARYLKDWPECPHCKDQVSCYSGVEKQTLGEECQRTCYGCGNEYTIQRVIRYTTRTVR